MREIDIPGIELEGFIGSGANATVYAGIDLETETKVAIKVMHVGIEGGKRRFDRETESMRRLAGVPGVVPLIRAGLLEKDRPFLVTPLYQGSVQDQLTEQRPLDVVEATELIAGIADAVSAGHELGILHLDVKPSNILLTNEGEAVLADFGIAERVDGSSSLSGAMLTPQYAAPERLEDEPPSAGADVYALGATLFALVVGNPPYKTSETANPAAVMMRILNEDPPLHQLPDETPEDVRDAIAAAMQREVENRPSANEFSEMLRRFDEATVVRKDAPRQTLVGNSEPTVPLPPTALAAGDVDGVRTRKAMFAVAAGFIGLLAIGLALLISGGDDESIDVEVAGETTTATTEASDAGSSSDDSLEPNDDEQVDQDDEPEVSSTTTTITPPETTTIEAPQEVPTPTSDGTSSTTTTTGQAPTTTQPPTTTGQAPTTTQPPTTTAAPTTLPSVPVVAVTLANVNFNAAGNDEENPADEFLDLVNGGSEVSLAGWTISDCVNGPDVRQERFVFQAGDVLGVGETLRFHAGGAVGDLSGGAATAVDQRRFGAGAFMTNSGDRVLLQDASGAIVASASWTDGGVTYTQSTNSGCAGFEPPAPVVAVTLANVNFNAAGNDEENPADEFLDLVNGGSEVSLAGWTISDCVNGPDVRQERFVFQAGDVLGVGETLRFHAGGAVGDLSGGAATAVDQRRFGAGAFMTNSGDRVLLQDASGAIVASASWTDGGVTYTQSTNNGC